MKDKHITVLSVEDDPDFSYLIQEQLEEAPDITYLGSAACREDALPLAQSLKPQIVLMDLNLSRSYMDGVEASRQIRLQTDARVIILTVFEEPAVVIEASKLAFANGYLFKSQFDLLVDTILATGAGNTPQELMIQSLILNDLSPAERTVFDMMMGKEIELSSAKKTISNQKTNVLRKLGLQNQRELVKLFNNTHC